MSKLLKLIIIPAWIMAVSSAYAQEDYRPSPEIVEAQEQFRENRFGIFIHWGIYSMYGQGEWALNYNGLTHEEYSKMAGGFYPAGFDAAEWVSAIKASGARYICITTRHHDGFSMFDSKCTDYDIMDATPFKRDIIAELAAECERQDMPLHFYYSLIDWGRTDAPRGRTGQGTGRPEATDPDTYFDFMKCQLTELLTRYGKVGCIWFDGNWDHEEWEQPLDYRYDELYPLIHELQPGCLIGNNHHITPYPGENIQIFERDIPGENTAGWHSGGVFVGLIGQEDADGAKHHGAEPLAEPWYPFAAFGHFLSRYIDDVVEDEDGHGDDDGDAKAAFPDDGSEGGADEEEEQAGQRKGEFLVPFHLVDPRGFVHVGGDQAPEFIFIGCHGAFLHGSSQDVLLLVGGHPVV